VTEGNPHSCGNFCESKIHRPIVTGADLDYGGSILVDAALLKAAGISPFESLPIWNVANGRRFETYAIEGLAGSNQVILNGAAARLVHGGDKVITATFCWLDDASAARHEPTVVLLGEGNEMLPGSRH
jgi:aspartate 1-decarboxylase